MGEGFTSASVPLLGGAQLKQAPGTEQTETQRVKDLGWCSHYFRNTEEGRANTGCLGGVGKQQPLLNIQGSF